MTKRTDVLGGPAKRSSHLDSLDVIETLLDGAQRRNRITLTRIERLEKALEKSEEEWNGTPGDTE